MISSFEIANPIVRAEDIEFDDNQVVEDDGAISIDELNANDDSDNSNLDNDNNAENLNKDEDKVNEDNELNDDSKVSDDSDANDIVNEDKNDKQTDDVSDNVDSESINDSNEVVVPSDFSEYHSDTFDFSIGYPKNWYFAGSTPSKAGSIRHYDFGDKPLDEEDGDVSLDIFNGDVHNGKSSVINGESVYISNNGDKVVYSVVKNGKTYSVEGPKSDENVIRNMILSIK